MIAYVVHILVFKRYRTRRAAEIIDVLTLLPVPIFKAVFWIRSHWIRIQIQVFVGTGSRRRFFLFQIFSNLHFETFLINTRLICFSKHLKRIQAPGEASSPTKSFFQALMEAFGLPVSISTDPIEFRKQSGSETLLTIVSLNQRIQPSTVSLLLQSNWWGLFGQAAQWTSSGWRGTSPTSSLLSSCFSRKPQLHTFSLYNCCGSVHGRVMTFWYGSGFAEPLTNI